MNWYLVQTKPNSHQVASENLKQQGFEVFLPLIAKTSKKGIKFINELKPLFPNYLFMVTELTKIPWKSINSTRGVSKAVTFDGAYRIVDAAIINEIKLRCDHIGIFRKLDDISAGDRVKIERGPFADFICDVDKISESNRAWVLIDILHQKIKAKIALSDLTKTV